MNTLLLLVALQAVPPGGLDLNGAFTFGVAGVDDGEHAPPSVQLVQLSCTSGRCSVATFDLEACTDEKMLIGPVFKLFSAETLRQRRRADGVIELMAEETNGYAYVFTFRIERDSRGAVWLKEFSERTTIVRSGVVFERVATRELSLASIGCNVVVRGLGANGMPAPLTISQPP